MNSILQTIVTIVCTFAGASGFWAYLQNRRDKKSASNKMLIGLGHDRIIYLCMSYIRKGEITQSEYENLYVWLYQPYEEMGGNGSAKRLMDEVKKLKIVPDTYGH